MLSQPPRKFRNQCNGRLLTVGLLVVGVLPSCGVRIEKPPPPDLQPGQRIAVTRPVLARPANLGFEAVNGEVPSDWDVNDRSRFAFDDETKTSGVRGARLDRGWGAKVSQCVIADGYRGKRIMLSGDLKTAAEVDGSGSLWLRAVHHSGRRYEEARPGGEGDASSGNPTDRRSAYASVWWARYRVAVSVPASAGFVCYGLSTLGEGVLWADDLTLVIDQ